MPCQRREAWEPTLEEFCQLVQAVRDEKLNCSHNNYGRWSFWRVGVAMVDAAQHVILDADTGRFCCQRGWLNEDEALSLLGLRP